MTSEAVAVGGAVVLVAATSIMGQLDHASVDGWKELGALAILGMVVVWLITRTLPEMAKEHRQSLKEIVKSFTEEQQRTRDEAQKHETNAQARHERLLDEIRKL